MIPNMFLLEFILGRALFKGFSSDLSVFFLTVFYRKKVENLLQLEPYLASFEQVFVQMKQDTTLKT